MTTGNDVERQLEQVRRRAFRHWYEDGISEMVTGGYLVLLALFSLAADMAGPTSWMARFENMILLLYVIAGAFLIRWLVQRGKEQVTYTRSGYVRFPKTTDKSWVRLVAIAVLAATVGAVFVLSETPWSRPASLAVLSLIFFAAFAYLAIRTRLARFYVIAAGGGFLPWISLLLGLESVLQYTFVYGGLGVLLLITGLWTFLHFVRRPPLDEEGGSHA